MTRKLRSWGDSKGNGEIEYGLHVREKGKEGRIKFDTGTVSCGKKCHQAETDVYW